MTRHLLAVICLAWPLTNALAAYRVAGPQPVPMGPLEGKGQPADPRVSPDGRFLAFEFLGAEGDSLETFLVGLDGVEPSVPEPIVPRKPADPFSLGRGGDRPVSEGISWGPPKRGKPRLAVAATRKGTSRGASQINFDIFYSEPGRRRFLTVHPENDAQPAINPAGDVLAFVSGRTGQGDLYLYHFFAEDHPIVRISDESAGSELYPAWSHAGDRLAFVGHLGLRDHVYIIDDVPDLMAGGEASFHGKARDLTPGWGGSCLAPSFSPDGRWVAYYARADAQSGADLYVVPVVGGPPRRLLAAGLPETHGGPRWSPGGEGVVAVKESAEDRNPLVWVPIDGGEAEKIPVDTELNADPWFADMETGRVLFWTAQARDRSNEKRWRQIFRGAWVREGDE